MHARRLLVLLCSSGCVTPPPPPPPVPLAPPIAPSTYSVPGVVAQLYKPGQVVRVRGRKPFEGSVTCEGSSAFGGITVFRRAAQNSDQQFFSSLNASLDANVANLVKADASLSSKVLATAHITDAAVNYVDTAQLSSPHLDRSCKGAIQIETADTLDVIVSTYVASVCYSVRSISSAALDAATVGRLSSVIGAAFSLQSQSDTSVSSCSEQLIWGVQTDGGEGAASPYVQRLVGASKSPCAEIDGLWVSSIDGLESAINQVGCNAYFRSYNNPHVVHRANMTVPAGTAPFTFDFERLEGANTCSQKVEIMPIDDNRLLWTTLPGSSCAAPGSTNLTRKQGTRFATGIVQ